MLKVCFCPATLAWITKHLRKDAKKAWRNLIKRNSTTTKRKSFGNTKANKAAMKRFPKIKGGKRKQTNKQKIQQKKFSRCAKSCKGKKNYRACMAKCLKKKR